MPDLERCVCNCELGAMPSMAKKRYIKLVLKEGIKSGVNGTTVESREFMYDYEQYDIKTPLIGDTPIVMVVKKRADNKEETTLITKLDNVILIDYDSQSTTFCV